jgi:hypothetical protein
MCFSSGSRQKADDQQDEYKEANVYTHSPLPSPFYSNRRPFNHTVDNFSYIHGKLTPDRDKYSNFLRSKEKIVS